MRVFGSVVAGEDRPDSDVDRLFVMNKPLSLMQLGQLEQQVGDLFGAPVDLVPESAFEPTCGSGFLAEAVSL